MSKSSKRNGKRSAAKPHGQKLYRRPETGSAAATDFAALEGAVQEHPWDVASALALAEEYGRRREEGKILEVLGRFEVQYPFADAEVRRTYNRLMAYGYAHMDRCLEAEDVLRRSFEGGDNSPDLHYVHAYVKMTMREYDDVIAACSQYVASLRGAEEQRVQLADFAVTAAHVSQMYNMLGSAYREKRLFSEAEAAYQQSIQADAGNHLPYLNLVGVQAANGKREAAKETVRLGIKNCRQGQELRLVAETLKARATVSACLIVKNEEDLLPGCLDSIRDWVDEIILVDTGSTDRTVEIAQQYGAKIFHQPWEGNFSKHRNYSIEQATRDWVMIIDADERFCAEDLANLKALLNSERIAALSIDVYNVYEDAEGAMSFLPSIRFFRRETNLRYQGIVHNVLHVPSEFEVHRAGVRIKHLGYDLSKEKMAQKAQRTSALLQKQLDENPDNVFALFNYAQLLTGRRKEDLTAHADEILRMAGRAVELIAPDSVKERNLRLMCLNQMAWTYFFTDRLDQAAAKALTALEYKPNYLDPLLLLGHIETRRERYDEAAEHYQRYLDEQKRYDASKETDNMIINHVHSRANALYGLAMIADLKGDRERAIKLYRETLAATPNYLEANTYLGRLLVAEGLLQQAEQHFRAQIAGKTYSREAWMQLAKLAANRGDVTVADDAYKHVLSVNPDDAEATIGLGKALQKAGRLEEAAAYLARAGELGATDRQARIKLSQSLFELGKYADALEGFRAALAERESSELYNDLGNCHFRLEETRLAADCYRKATETPPVAPVAYRNLGVAETRLKRYPEALAAFETYLERDTATPEVLSLVGDLHMKQGQIEAAMEAFERVLVAKPQDAEALVKLSDCYLHMGHRDSAIMGYQRVLQIDPANAPAQHRLNELLAIAGKA